jgi:hypothetical protein
MIHPADKKLAETAGKIPVWAIILVVVVAGAFYSYRESKARKDYK